jgi:hypothetical protein
MRWLATAAFASRRHERWGMWLKVGGVCLVRLFYSRFSPREMRGVAVRPIEHEAWISVRAWLVSCCRCHNRLGRGTCRSLWPRWFSRGVHLYAIELRSHPCSQTGSLSCFPAACSCWLAPRFFRHRRSNFRGDWCSNCCAITCLIMLQGADSSMSAFDTKRTSKRRPAMAAFGGKADMTRT